MKHKQLPPVLVVSEAAPGVQLSGMWLDWHMSYDVHKVKEAACEQLLEQLNLQLRLTHFYVVKKKDDNDYDGDNSRNHHCHSCNNRNNNGDNSNNDDNDGMIMIMIVKVLTVMMRMMTDDVLCK